MPVSVDPVAVLLCLAVCTVAVAVGVARGRRHGLAHGIKAGAATAIGAVAVLFVVLAALTVLYYRTGGH